jgi:SAM-dependent methyltransferase
MGLFVTILAVLIFIGLAIGSLYLVMLFINSKGFRISPTVTSDAKSIKKMQEFILKYNDEHLKKPILKILDVGSGYGRLLFKMNKYLKNDKNIFIGYEISKFPYLISKFFNKYKNIYLINDDINNIQDTDFDFVITFMLEKQQKDLIPLYNKFPKNTIIFANSNDIPFSSKDNFVLIDKIKVHIGWNIYVYRGK